MSRVEKITFSYTNDTFCASTSLKTVSESVSKDTLMCVEHNLGTHYRAPSRQDGLSIPLEARVTTAEVLSCRTAATDLRCGPRKAVFQFSTPSGEFRAKVAEPSATCERKVITLLRGQKSQDAE